MKHLPFFRFKSLSSKLLITIVIWVLCLMTFVVATIHITWKLEDHASVINQAGQLTQRIYRLTALIESKQETAQKKQHIEADRKSIQIIFDSIKSQTQGFCCQSPDGNDLSTPLESSFVQLMHLFSKATEGYISSETLLNSADRFAQHIDIYTQHIEDGNTRMIERMRILRLVLVSLILLSAISLFILLKKWVINPLLLIYQAIKQVTEGQLSTRTHIASRDEFAVVSEGFNKMAGNLEDMYQNLEHKVSTKTQKLAKQNENWATLNRLSSYLHTNYSSQEVLNHFLSQLIHISQAQAGSIYLIENNHWTQVADLAMTEELSQEIISQIHKTRLIDHVSGYFSVDIAKRHLMHPHKPAQLHIFPIYHVGILLGVFSIYIETEHQLEESHFQLLVLLCAQLGITVENMQLMMKEKQHAVLEERHLMAQGLHDNIAQSLSFLNLQIQLLNKAAKQQQIEKIQENLSFIQEGIQHCYDDVRELLMHFRTKVLNDNLMDTVESIITRYQKQMGLPIRLFVLTDTLNLNAEQQLQVMFILQEALSNAMKHANATQIEVILEDEDDFRMVVKDDGSGFIPEPQKTSEYATGHHIGLLIMQERAAKINAMISVNSVPNLGTTVELIIPFAMRNWRKGRL